jgi:hypothetical protein
MLTREKVEKLYRQAEGKGGYFTPQVVMLLASDWLAMDALLKPSDFPELKEELEEIAKGMDVADEAVEAFLESMVESLTLYGRTMIKFGYDTAQVAAMKEKDGGTAEK